MTPEPTASPPPSTPAAWDRQPALFIYYRVHPQHLDHVVLAIQQQQRQLKLQHPGLLAALMRRADAAPAQATLMEVYTLATGPGAQASLPAREIEAAMAPVVLQGWLLGPRQAEEFVPCA